MFLKQNRSTRHADSVDPCRSRRERVQGLSEDESMSCSQRVRCEAHRTASGVLHGLQNLPSIVGNHHKRIATPVVTIKDRPRFPWRGLLIDVGRHLSAGRAQAQPRWNGCVEMNCSALALVRQRGFPCRDKHFPRLQEIGPTGGYYTQAEIREFVAYAGDRGIRVSLSRDAVPQPLIICGIRNLASAPGPYS